jgi:phosphoribosylaminoimidazolecarboxamide formyltransferase/IMP cyclohydrolase
MSFNNYVDAEAAHRLCQDMDDNICKPSADSSIPKPTAYVTTFIKHTNPCGVGIGHNPLTSYERAYMGDPNAAMGGILAMNAEVDERLAEAVMESLDRWGKTRGASAFFVELWLARSFEENAIEVIRSRKSWGNRTRTISMDDTELQPYTIPSDFFSCIREHPLDIEYRHLAGGFLLQSRDLVGLNEDQWKTVTKRKPSESEISDLRLAWLIAKHTKSNAISVCKDGMLIGNGAGQMSRVMSCRIATWLAQENRHADKLPGAAAASDAFFPFSDGPNLLIDAGVTALIQPGGSKRDEEVIAACDARDVAMIFTGIRHFKH